MKKSFLSTHMRSPLIEAQKLNGKSPKKVTIKQLAQALPLTSLIDAFSIIVIYLLVATQSGFIETSIGELKLPMAKNSQILEKEVAVLKVENGRFFLNEKQISLNKLTESLLNLKKSSSDKNIELMVQADQELTFASLDPLIKAGSLAGIEKLKFAVLPTK